MKKIRASFLILLSTAMGSMALADTCRSPDGETFQAAKSRLSQKILRDVLKYAFQLAHPRTGFVLDTVNNYSDTPHDPNTSQRASISSTGFMMALVAVASKKQMVPAREAMVYCRRPIVAVLEKQKQDEQAALERKKTGAADPQVDIGFRGWWSHFIDWANGNRWLDSEYALTDSTWMLAGMIVCAQSFPDSDIPGLVRNIYSQVDYQAMMTDGGASPAKRTLSLSYTPAPVTPPPPASKVKLSGYSPLQWDIYQHSWLVYLLGMGSPNEDLALPRASWSAWKRTGSILKDTNTVLDGKFLYGDHRALFSHYFPDVFLPPREIHEKCEIDYFENSRMATHFNKVSSLEDKTSKTFVAGLWGLDAGPNPDFAVLREKKTATLQVGLPETESYGVNTPYKRDGTACPACAVAAAMFDPDLIFSSLKQWCDDPTFGDKIWGNYGPANGINLDQNWISPHVLSGISGPMALSVANIDYESSVWKVFLTSEEVQRGLAKAREASLPTAPPGQDPCHLSEAQRQPKPALEHNPHTPDNAR